MTTASITCVVNAHREGQLIHTTLRSVDRARKYAKKSGIESDLIVILDRPDELTREFTAANAGDGSKIFEVDYGEPAQSRNFAVTNIQTEYTTFLDGDDLWCKNWLTECYQFFIRTHRDYILHPEINAYFGPGGEHLMKHIDMESGRFSHEFLQLMNYWTALSFSRTSVYEKTTYRKNQFDKGIGYEDWTWNWETVQKGIIHKSVPDTIHFVRRGKHLASRSEMATRCRAIPEILNIYQSDIALGLWMWTIVFGGIPLNTDQALYFLNQMVWNALVMALQPFCSSFWGRGCWGAWLASLPAFIT